MVKKGVIAIVSILLVLLIPIFAFALPNPAAIYCTELGYDYHEVVLEDSTEIGYCNADGIECEEWAFYKGECAPEKSACGINGYDTITASDGEDPYSQEYAVCVEREPDPITGLATYAGENTGGLGRFLKWLGAYMMTGHAVIDTNQTGESITDEADNTTLSNETVADIPAANETVPENTTGDDDVSPPETAVPDNPVPEPPTSPSSLPPQSKPPAHALERMPAFKMLNLEESVKDYTIDYAPEEDAPPKSLPEEFEATAAEAQSLGGGDRASVSTPSSFDWRNYNGENWNTPIKNQGGCGSCWAFGAVATAEAKLKITRGDPDFNPDLSEQELVSCSSAGDCGGGYHDSALNYIKNTGIADEGCRQYTATNSACGSCLGESKRKWYIDGTHKYSDVSTSTAKSYIVNYGPIAVNYYHYGSFDSNGVYRCSNECSIFSDYFYNHWSHSHVVSLVGYNDAGGYWIAKNSWGPYYQDGGYFKIGYGECEILYGCPLDYSRSLVYVDKTWPDTSKTVNVSWVSMYDGGYSGSKDSMRLLDGNYVSYYDHCSGSTCDGVSAYTAFAQSEFQNPQRMTLYANVRGRDASDFELYRQYSSTEYLGYIPQSSTNFYLMKYDLCDTEAECEALFYNNYLRMIYTHPACTSCNSDYLDVDWFVIETELDTDDDNTPDQDDACPTTYGTWCHGCPQPTCAPCSYNPTCPSSGAPYCASRYGSSTMCDSTNRCSSGAGNNHYNIGGEYYCKGYCDGSGNCDYANSCYYSTTCDTDDDNDGVLDANDDCPNTPGGSTVDSNGCRQVDVDQDLDGTCDSGKSSPTWCDGIDACPTTYGTSCNGCPPPDPDPCRTMPICPPSGPPYYLGFAGTSTVCDSTYRCSFGSGDNNYNTLGEYSCKGYCDGAGHCDYAGNCTYSVSCDTDDDNDGVADMDDDCAGTSAGSTVDINGCNQTQVDTDADGVCSIRKSSPTWCTGMDWCGNTPSGATVDSFGCSQSQVDSDSDGVCNEDYLFNTPWCDGEDLCANTPKAYSVDYNGCAQVQVDYDLDGLCNPGASSSTWCTGLDSCQSKAGPSCNSGCPDSDAPPTILISPTNTTYTSNTVQVKVDVDTGTENCLHSVWLVNGSSTIPLTSTYSGNMLFPKGNTTITLYANDTSGNTNSTSANFRIAYDPGITINLPKNTTYLESEIVVNVTVNETVSEIRAQLDNSSDLLLCSDCSSAYAAIHHTDGWHDLNVSVTDMADDEFITQFRFFIDTVPPQIHNYNFRPVQKLTGNSSTVFTVNYSEQFLDTVMFFFDLNNETVAGCSAGEYQTCSVTKDLSLLSHGSTAYFSFVVNETSGRKDVLYAPNDTGPYRIIIDRQAPVITVNDPANNSELGYFFYLNASFDENVLTKYSLDHAANISISPVCKDILVEFADMPAGIHNITLWATDEVGHVSSAFLNFSVVENASETDDDNDGVDDASDLCPYSPPGSVVDENGCRRSDVDADSDGVCNPGNSSLTWCSGQDNCTGTPIGSTVDANGCRQVDVDQDLDGTCDSGKSSPTWCNGTDACPSNYGTDCNGCNNPKSNPCMSGLTCPASGKPYFTVNATSDTQCNTFGKCASGSGDNLYDTLGEYVCMGYCDSLGNCDYADNCTYSVSCDTDDDDDGVADVSDDCAGSSGAVDSNGCNSTQVDSDLDGICEIGSSSPVWCNYTDWCPGTAGGAVIDANGCSQEQVDPDTDGICTQGESSPTWCNGSDLCHDQAGPSCNDGCPDPRPPLIYMISPVAKAYNYSNISIHAVSSDTCMHRMVFFNGTVNQSIDSGIPTDAVFAEGWQTITAYANDTSGNTNSTSVTFLVDTIFPALSVPSPANDSELGYWFWFNVSVSENTSIRYLLDNATALNLCANCNRTATKMSGLSIGLHKLVVYAADRASNTNTSMIYFRVGPDFDRDGIPDLLDDDDDDDGVDDTDDTLLGNVSHIDQNFGNLSIEVNNSLNLSKSFKDVLNITFRDNNTPILIFRFNFSYRMLNLSGISIRKQTDPSKGAIIIRGLHLIGHTKTAFIDDLDPSISTLCIKDAEVDSLDDISSDCSGSDEHYISCPGTNAGYSCILNGTKYMVTGLQYSAVEELYVPPSTPSGGGGSGGGGSYSVVEEPEEEKPKIDWSFLLPPDYSLWKKKSAEEPAPVTREAPVKEATTPAQVEPEQTPWVEGPAPAARQGFVLDTVNIIISVVVLAGILAGVLLMMLARRKGTAEKKAGAIPATGRMLPNVIEHGLPAELAKKSVPVVTGVQAQKKKTEPKKKSIPKKAIPKRHVPKKPAGPKQAIKSVPKPPAKKTRMQEIEDNIKQIKEKLKKDGL